MSVGGTTSLYWLPTTGQVTGAGYAPGGPVGVAVSAGATTSMTSYAGFDFIGHWWEPADTLPTLSWTEPEAGQGDAQQAESASRGTLRPFPQQRPPRPSRWPA